MNCDLLELIDDQDNAGSEQKYSMGSDTSLTENLDVSKSPEKLQENGYKVYNNNVQCKMITQMKGLDNPYIVPFLFNCQEDDPGIISEAVPIGIQDNVAFVLCLDTLEHRKDLFSNDNGSWDMTSCKAKFCTITRDDGGKVVELEKVSIQASAEVAVKEEVTHVPPTRHIIRQLCPSNLQKILKNGSHLRFLIAIWMVSPEDLRSKSMAIEPRPICLISYPKRALSLKLPRKLWNFVRRGRCL